MMLSSMNKKLLAGMLVIATNLVEGLLGLRILLKLLGASVNAPFVRWIYETTKPLINPFDGMFPSSEIIKGFHIEFSSIFALITYSFVGYMLIEAIDLISATAKQKPKK